MKGKKNLIIVSILSFVGIVTSCNGTVTPKDETTIDLKEVINNFNKATSYDLTGDIGFSIGTSYKDGIQTTTYAREYAIEYNEATGGQIMTTVAYANYTVDDVTSVMQYSYDDNGDVKAGYIVDKGKTIKTSKKVDLGISSLDIPSNLKDGSLTYELTPELGRDKKLLESITSKAVNGLTYKLLKQLGTIDSTVLSADEDGNGFKLVITYASDEETVANGGKIVIAANHFNGGQDLAIKDYITDGGQPKAISNEAKKLYEYAWSNCYISLSSEGTVGENGSKQTYSSTFKLVMNTQYGYMAYIYDEGSTTKGYDADGNETVVEAKSVAYIPVYGVSGLENNFYAAYINADGSIDLDLNDLSTFKDRNLFTSDASSQYFTSLQNMYSIMIYGSLGISFLCSLSSISEEDNLYMLGDYTQITDEDYGFFSIDDVVIEDVESYWNWSNSDTAEYGNIYGGAFMVSYGDTDEESTVSVWAVLDNGNMIGNQNLSYTGFGSSICSISGVDSMIASLYPEE